KSLFDKLEEDYGLGCLSGDELIGEEIKGLDLQFQYKGKWRSLDCTELIDFQIRKNPSFDLVLGQDWLWMREAKISFGFSSETCSHHAKLVIDNMSIPLIEENSRPFRDNSLSHKASSTKNNSSNSMDLKPDLEELVDMFKKLSLKRFDDVSKNSGASKKNRVEYSMNSDTSDSSDSSLSRLRSEVINMHKKRCRKVKKKN
ncbi:11352_t:CDS:1, partial [Paraglomus occultum]